MVDYPNLSSLDANSGIAGFLSLPNASYPFFWAWIMGAIWFIIVLTLYFKEQEKVGKARILSSMAVACLTITLLSVIGSVLTIISIEIMVNILVMSLVVIGIWVFSSD